MRLSFHQTSHTTIVFKYFIGFVVVFVVVMAVDDTQSKFFAKTVCQKVSFANTRLSNWVVVVFVYALIGAVRWREFGIGVHSGITTVIAATTTVIILEWTRLLTLSRNPILPPISFSSLSGVLCKTFRTIRSFDSNDRRLYDVRVELQFKFSLKKVQNNLERLDDSKDNLNIWTNFVAFDAPCNSRGDRKQ